MEPRGWDGGEDSSKPIDAEAALAVERPHYTFGPATGAAVAQRTVSDPESPSSPYVGYFASLTQVENSRFFTLSVSSGARFSESLRLAYRETDRFHGFS